jgi:ATP-binding cassette subfamily B protein
VLNGISFDIRPGMFVAIVGPTGVGKTTMVKLASRLYDPTEGVITLDGHDLRKLALSSLRKALAYVPQDTFLFNCTIAENIAFGKPEASRDEIVRAAKIARIHDDIIEMPDGYDTMAGERGIKLSGGQKQRVAIARAVICGAPVLILDEATSSVDAQTERLIQRSIDELTGSHTVIAIAHRLSTIKNADLILVIEEGNLVQSGTHEELMERDGLYARMYRLQTEKERLMEEERLLKI